MSVPQYSNDSLSEIPPFRKPRHYRPTDCRNPLTPCHAFCSSPPRTPWTDDSRHATLKSLAPQTLVPSMLLAATDRPIATPRCDRRSPSPRLRTSFGYALGLELDTELVFLHVQPNLEQLVAFADRIHAALQAQGWPSRSHPQQGVEMRHVDDSRMRAPRRSNTPSPCTSSTAVWPTRRSKPIVRPARSNAS
jgi:hypothetical protein